MNKKELAELVRKIAAMQAAMVVMQQQMAEIANRLRFIPVCEASSSDDDMEDALNTPRRTPR